MDHVSRWSKVTRVSHGLQRLQALDKSSHIVRSVSMKIMAEASAGESNKPCSVVCLVERQLPAALSPSVEISDAAGRFVDRLSQVMAG